MRPLNPTTRTGLIQPRLTLRAPITLRRRRRLEGGARHIQWTNRDVGISIAASGETAGASASSPQFHRDSGTSTSATNDIQPPGRGAGENPVTPRAPTGEPEVPGERAAEGALMPTRGNGGASSS